MTVVVAVDGPAGSGKSSVSRAAAARLGYAYLDTGAAYRAIAWHGLDTGVDFSDPVRVEGLLDSAEIDIATNPAERWVRVGPVDVTEAIRTPQVSAAVAAVAKTLPLRARLNAWFRELIAAAGPGIVVEGRDITTVVAPDADVRVLLTAAAEVRAARRAGELGTAATGVASVAEAIAKRDASDSTVVDFMEPAEGVELLDSTGLDFDATVDAVVALVHGKERA
jgi:cytidylate kinase